MSMYLKESRSKARLTQKQLADALGLDSEQNISKWERGEMPVAWHHFDRLISVLRLERAHFMKIVKTELPEAYASYQRYAPDATAEVMPEPRIRSRAERTVRVVPVINQASCGKWRDFSDLDYPAGHAEQELAASTHDSQAFFVIASGDSMIGSKIEEGDLLLIEPSRSVEDGHIVLAKNHEGCTVKKFFQHGDHIELRPMNEAHKSIFVKNDPSLRVYRISQIVKRI